MAIVAVTSVLGGVSGVMAFRDAAETQAAVNNCPAGQSHLADGFGCVTIRQSGQTVVASELPGEHVLSLAGVLFVFRDEDAFAAAGRAVAARFPDPRALEPFLTRGPRALELEVPELTAG